MSRLIQIEQEWVPHAESSSLYIRPTLIGTEPTLGVGAANEVLLFVILSPVGPYFASGLKPVNLVADPNFVRAWPGGCGYAKMGSNYAPTMWTQVRYFSLPYFLETNFGYYIALNEQIHLMTK